MTQGVLPFKYEEEKKDSGMTSLGGLPIYLDLASAMRLPDESRKTGWMQNRWWIPGNILYLTTVSQ
jgi:hypothetical protein